MVNISKSRENRFWSKWKNSGAIGSIAYSKYPDLKDSMPGLNKVINVNGHWDFKSNAYEHFDRISNEDKSKLTPGDVFWTSEELNPSIGKVYGYEKQVVISNDPLTYRQVSANGSWSNRLRESEPIFTISNTEKVFNLLKRHKNYLVHVGNSDTSHNPVNGLIRDLEKKLN